MVRIHLPPPASHLRTRLPPGGFQSSQGLGRAPQGYCPPFQVMVSHAILLPMDGYSRKPTASYINDCRHNSSDKFQHRAVGIVKIGARSVEHAALPVLLERDLDVMSAQMIERRWIPLMCDDEGVMHTPMVVEHGIDRQVALHQDEARPGCIKEGQVRRQCLPPRAPHGDNPALGLLPSNPSA